tara:strand:- start:131 stop:1024 length:894 start_codon:yes stop_codon:yes gene_type:complete
MKAVLLALLIMASCLSVGCLSDQPEPIISNNIPGCYEEKVEENEQGCEVDFPVENNSTTNSENTTNVSGVNSGVNETNNTSNETNSTFEGNQTEVPEEPNYGPWEGNQVYPLTADARALGGVWENWQLYNHFNSSWNGTPVNMSNGTDENWIMIEFASTDCSHCWNAADDMTYYHQNYSEVLTLFTFAVNFSSNDHFNASLEEIAAFQDKSSHGGCYMNSKNCNERPGDPHNWTYVDDRNQSSMYAMQSRGTPMFVIIMPNGIVAWHQYQHDGDGGEDSESITDALQRFFGPMNEYN